MPRSNESSGNQDLIEYFADRGLHRKQLEADVLGLREQLAALQAQLGKAEATIASQKVCFTV